LIDGWIDGWISQDYHSIDQSINESVDKFANLSTSIFYCLCLLAVITLMTTLVT